MNEFVLLLWIADTMQMLQFIAACVVVVVPIVFFMCADSSDCIRDLLKHKRKLISALAFSLLVLCLPRSQPFRCTLH